MGIRLATAEDHDKISQLMQSAWLGPYDPTTVSLCWVYEDNGEIVGSAGIHFVDPDIGVLKHLVVREDCRKRGIGEALIKVRLDSALERNCSLLALCTMYYRFKFFSKRGFRTIKRQDLPIQLKGYPQFTDKKLMKCGIMINDTFNKRNWKPIKIGTNRRLNA